LSREKEQDLKLTEKLIEGTYRDAVERYMDKNLEFIMSARKSPAPKEIEAIHHRIKVSAKLKLIPAPEPRKSEEESWLPWESGWKAREIWLELKANPVPENYVPSPMVIKKGELKLTKKCRAVGYSTKETEVMIENPKRRKEKKNQSQESSETESNISYPYLSMIPSLELVGSGRMEDVD